MTAGKGIVHEEFHSQDFTRKGGPFQMVQWSMGLIPGDATPCSKPEKLTTTAKGR